MRVHRRENTPVEKRGAVDRSLRISRERRSSAKRLYATMQPNEIIYKQYR